MQAVTLQIEKFTQQLICLQQRERIEKYISIFILKHENIRRPL